MLDGQTLPQPAKTVLLVILLQFNLLLSWSLITGSAMRKRMRRQRKTANKTSARPSENTYFLTPKSLINK